MQLSKNCYNFINVLNIYIILIAFILDFDFHLQLSHDIYLKLKRSILFKKLQVIQKKKKEKEWEFFQRIKI